MDVEQLLREQLKRLGADGLMFVDCDGCGCTIEDFIPCGGDNIQGCIAAKLVKCTADCNHGERLDQHFEPFVRKAIRQIARVSR